MSRLPDKINITWMIDDVLMVAPDLTKQEARKALQLAKQYHNAEMGVNWDVLKIWAEEVREQR